MKKVFATVLGAALMLIGTQAFAQASIGVGYINASDKTVTTSGSSASTSDKADLNGFYVGFDYNLNIVAGLGVQTGLYADMLFSSASTDAIVISGTGSFKEIDLNIPLNLTYTFPLNRDFSIFAYAGPTFQFGVYKNYKVRATGKITGKDYGESWDYYKDVVPNHKPFNIYIGGGAGFQAGNIQVKVGYDHSLMNMIDSSDSKRGRGQIKIGVGFAF